MNKLLSLLFIFITTFVFSQNIEFTKENFKDNKDKLKEAALIFNVENQLEVKLQMRKSFEAFIDSLPLGCYQTGSITMVCKQKVKKKKIQPR